MNPLAGGTFVLWLIAHTKGGAILWARPATVIDAGHSNVGVPEPLLHFCNIRSLVERVRRRRSAGDVRTKSHRVDSHPPRVVTHHALINLAGSESAGELPFAPRVFHRSKQRAVSVLAMPAEVEIVGDPRRGHRMRRHEPDFAALAVNAQVRHALALLHIFDAQFAPFLAPQPMEE